METQKIETQTNMIVLTRESSTSSISTDSDCENYVIKANICPRLSQELSLPEIVYDIGISDYEPPNEPGLTNSGTIIPAYYKLDKHPSKILEIDYLYIIEDDIINLRPLNQYQLDYIKQLSHESKNELFELFNECLKNLNEII
jgi:hypothetical protein